MSVERLGSRLAKWRLEARVEGLFDALEHIYLEAREAHAILTELDPGNRVLEKINETWSFEPPGEDDDGPEAPDDAG